MAEKEGLKSHLKSSGSRLCPRYDESGTWLGSCRKGAVGRGLSASAPLQGTAMAGVPSRRRIGWVDPIITIVVFLPPLQVR